LWFFVVFPGSAAAIAIVSATPVGKWENPGGLSLGTAGMDASIAVVAPSVSEKGELGDGGGVVDVADPGLVSAGTTMLGSPATDNKLRLTGSAADTATAAAVGIAKVTAHLILNTSISRVPAGHGELEKVSEFECSGKGQGKIFLGKVENRCHQMSDF